MQQQLTKQAPEGFLLVGRIDAPGGRRRQSSSSTGCASTSDATTT
ncbi:MAG: hypothetical protein ACLR3C_07115 [Eggerthella lenta]